MRLVEGQIIVAALRAMYQHAEITSGAYKLRVIGQGVEPEDVSYYEAEGLMLPDDGGKIRFRHLTNEEKLQESMAKMSRHIGFIQDCLEHLRSQ